MFVDIKRGFRQYSEQEILAYAQSGVLVCGDYELSDFLHYILEGYESIIYEDCRAKIEQEYKAWDQEV